MKYILLFAMQIVLFTNVHAQHAGHNAPPAKQAKAKVIYTCPMHPEVKSNQPGNCPKCGMNLVKKTIKIAAPKPAAPLKKEPTPPTQKTKPAITDSAIKNNDLPGHDHQLVENKQEDTTSGYAGTKVNMSPGKTVRYDLYITDTMVNYSGKSKHAYAINGTIPGPDLVFTEGDTAEIYLHNRLKAEETSLHWHGVILPNQFDGVPYLTTAPVFAGDVHLYKFAIHQNGTYWYHSHSGLQEQAGLYGALIFHKRGEQAENNHPTPAMEPMKMDHAGHDMKGMDMGGMQHKMQEENRMMDTMDKDHSMHGIKDMKMSGMQHQQMASMPVKGNGAYNAEQTVVLSEWTDEKPHEVLRRLRTANDWYAIQKGSTQSYSEAIKAGHFKTKVTNEWKRMNAMDVSDVYYDRFLINGKPVAQAAQYKAGDRVRLRIVNAGASSYFWVQYAGGKMTVIANDGNDVVPIEVDRLIVGVSETYDVVVTLANNMSYEFRATPEDRTKAASLWLGSGMKMPAPILPRLKYFEGMKMMNDMMTMNGNMKAMDMQMSLQQMDMNSVMYDELKNDPGQMQHTEMADTAKASMSDMQGMQPGNGEMVTLNYAMLQSPEKTMLPAVPYKELFFTLTGNMNRYVWSINNKVIREWDKIPIEKGQNVRIILYNNSMMRHPMHLHGHDFRVLNGQGEYAPLKNVLDIMPMETDTIEFAGSQSGDWFFHCHILYHMMAGMGNVFSYKNSPPNPELPNATAAYNKFLRNEQMIHPMAEIGLESNGSDGKMMLSTERYALRTEWRIGTQAMHGQESETYFGRYFGKMQWLFPFIGFDYHHNSHENELTKNAFGQTSNQSNRKAFIAGVEYTLPMLLVAQARVDSKGKFRFQLAREEMPLTPRLRLNLMANTDKEYMAGLRYVLKKWLALSTHYDSDMGLGAGVTLTY